LLSPKVGSNLNYLVVASVIALTIVGSCIIYLCVYKSKAGKEELKLDTDLDSAIKSSSNSGSAK